MRELSVDRRFVSFMDDDTFDAIALFNWKVVVDARRCPPTYRPAIWLEAVTSAPIWMHRFVIARKDGHIVDHKNGNSFDNQRKNLRHATNAQNAMNSRNHTPSETSPYKGVFHHPCWRTGRWRAAITVDKKLRVLGYFGTPEKAAKAYDRAAEKFFGEFARTNFGTAHALILQPSKKLLPSRHCGCSRDIDHLGLCDYRRSIHSARSHLIREILKGNTNAAVNFHL